MRNQENSQITLKGNEMIEFENFKWKSTEVKDLDYVIELEKEGYPYVIKWSKDKHKEAIHNNDIKHFLLWEEYEKIGYCILAGFEKGNDNIEIKRIVVGEKNRGVGRKSLQALLKYLFEKKEIHRVWLDYYEFNEVGAYLYESMGFKKDGVLRESLKFEEKYYDVVVLSMLKKEYFDNFK